jgi:hypothetical protein
LARQSSACSWLPPDPIERDVVVRAMDEAEEHTTNYYCFPPHRWQELRYDLITRHDREWEPMPDPVLAKVQCLERVGSRRKGPLEFWRIQLNDPGIMTVARRENLEPAIHPFLVYILTHEMVHVVRLSSILGNADLLSSDAEEQRVDRISRQILARAGFQRFGPVLDKFRSPRLAASEERLPVIFPGK